jgi:hypothetical protein
VVVPLLDRQKVVQKAARFPAFSRRGRLGRPRRGPA